MERRTATGGRVRWALFIPVALTIVLLLSMGDLPAQESTMPSDLTLDFESQILGELFYGWDDEAWDWRWWMDIPDPESGLIIRISRLGAPLEVVDLTMIHPDLIGSPTHTLFGNRSLSPFGDPASPHGVEVEILPMDPQNPPLGYLTEWAVEAVEWDMGDFFPSDEDGWRAMTTCELPPFEPPEGAFKIHDPQNIDSTGFLPPFGSGHGRAQRDYPVARVEWICGSPGQPNSAFLDNLTIRFAGIDPVSQKVGSATNAPSTDFGGGEDPYMLASFDFDDLPPIEIVGDPGDETHRMTLIGTAYDEAGQPFGTIEARVSRHNAPLVLEDAGSALPYDDRELPQKYGSASLSPFLDPDSPEPITIEVVSVPPGWGVEKIEWDMGDFYPSDEDSWQAITTADMPPGMEDFEYAVHERLDVPGFEFYDPFNSTRCSVRRTHHIQTLSLYAGSAEHPMSVYLDQLTFVLSPMGPDGSFSAATNAPSTDFGGGGGELAVIVNLPEDSTADSSFGPGNYDYGGLLATNMLMSLTPRMRVIDFGCGAAHTSQDSIIFLKNLSDEAMVVSIFIESPYATSVNPFTLVGGDLTSGPVELPPFLDNPTTSSVRGGRVRFSPVEPGRYQATLVVASTDPNGPTIRIPIAAVAVNAGALGQTVEQTAATIPVWLNIGSTFSAGYTTLPVGPAPPITGVSARFTNHLNSYDPAVDGKPSFQIVEVPPAAGGGWNWSGAVYFEEVEVSIPITEAFNSVYDGQLVVATFDTPITRLDDHLYLVKVTGATNTSIVTRAPSTGETQPADGFEFYWALQDSALDKSHIWMVTTYTDVAPQPPAMEFLAMDGTEIGWFPVFHEGEEVNFLIRVSDPNPQDLIAGLELTGVWGFPWIGDYTQLNWWPLEAEPANTRHFQVRIVPGYGEPITWLQAVTSINWMIQLRIYETDTTYDGGEHGWTMHRLMLDPEVRLLKKGTTLPFAEDGDTIQAVPGELLEFDVLFADENAADRLTAESTLPTGPSGISLEPVSGSTGDNPQLYRLSWRPSPADASATPYTFRFKCTDDVSLWHEVTLNVEVPAVPDLILGAPADQAEVAVNLGQPLSFTVTATHGGTGDLALTFDIPEGAEMIDHTVAGVTDPLNFEFSWTPGDLLDARAHTLTFRVTDTATGVYSEKAIVVRVRNLPGAPVIELVKNGELFAESGVPVGWVTWKPVDFTVRAFDWDPGDSVDLEVTGLPAGATWTPVSDPIGSVAYRFTWTPQVLDTGPVPITFTSSDGQLSTSFLLDVTITHDQDGDGIPDVWETDGYPYGDGQVLDLPGMGAKPDHKDVFVEIDYFQDGQAWTTRPLATALDAIRQSFANAPVENLDGVPGINLIIVVDEALPWVEALGPDPQKEGKYIWRDYPGVDFQEIKDEHFAPERHGIFHYCLFANTLGGGTVSGISRNATDGSGEGASDFIVALGNWGNWTIPLRDAQAGTFMHELGHNLGLRHGGTDNSNYKPNYLSVMNYFFQFGLDRRSLTGHISLYDLWKRFDYSRMTLPDINELTGVDEWLGVLGDTLTAAELAELSDHGTRWWYRIGGLSLLDLDALDRHDAWIADLVEGAFAPSIDWNDDGTMEVVHGLDLNADGAPQSLPNVYPVLRGAEDWSKLRFDGGNVGFGAPLPQPKITETEEADLAVAELMSNGEGPAAPPFALPVTDAATYYAPKGGAAEVTFTATNAFDPQGEPLTFWWYANKDLLGRGAELTASFEIGQHEVSLIVENSGHAYESPVAFVVEEEGGTVDPTAEAHPDVLWPPNGKFVNVTVSIDPDCFTGEIIAVTSNQPPMPDSKGVTEADWILTGGLGLKLRAERDATIGDRIYTVHLTATDESGNSHDLMVEVVVPHDQGRRSGASEPADDPTGADPAGDPGDDGPPPDGNPDDGDAAAPAPNADPDPQDPIADDPNAPADPPAQEDPAPLDDAPAPAPEVGSDAPPAGTATGDPTSTTGLPDDKTASDPRSFEGDAPKSVEGDATKSVEATEGGTEADKEVPAGSTEPELTEFER